MSKIAIFASGSGTNAENIIHFFRPEQNINVNLVLCNKPEAKVLERAEKLGVDHMIFSRNDLYHSDKVIDILRDYEIDFIVLAGFLWLVPDNLTQAFPNAIINIHPALLPKYGGKGMYGSKVHEAVVANREKETGITIHYVNENYDEGSIIFQAKCTVDEKDNADDVAAKIHTLEYENFPTVIRDTILGK